MSGQCETPEYATVREAAAILKVSEKTIYRMLDDGRLRRVKLRSGPTGPVRIPMEDIRALKDPYVAPSEATDEL